MSQLLTIDLENLSSDNGFGIKIVTFPNRTKIENVVFTVNWECWGNEEQDRNWLLYALASHPYEYEGYDTDWIWPIFGNSAKPVVSRASNLRFRSDVAPTGIYSAPFETPNMIREIHEGVLDAGDYIALWVECDSGDVEGISWEDTAAVVTIEYEETTKQTAYEQRDWWAFA